MIGLLTTLLPAVESVRKAVVITGLVVKYVAMTIFVLLAVGFFFTPEILLITALVG